MPGAIRKLAVSTFGAETPLFAFGTFGGSFACKTFWKKFTSSPDVQRSALTVRCPDHWKDGKTFRSRLVKSFLEVFWPLVYRASKPAKHLWSFSMKRRSKQLQRASKRTLKEPVRTFEVRRGAFWRPIYKKNPYSSAWEVEPLNPQSHEIHKAIKACLGGRSIPLGFLELLSTNCHQLPSSGTFHLAWKDFWKRLAALMEKRLPLWADPWVFYWLWLLWLIQHPPVGVFIGGFKVLKNLPGWALMIILL